MKITNVTKIEKGQDGAVWGGFLFRFKSKGSCSVYRLEDVKKAKVREEALPPFGVFRLDLADVLPPHSNAVVFGCEKYAPEDEFPLLYSNIYNNFSGEENKRKGTLCVYRIQRNGAEFSSQLVQLIRIGFCEDRTLWASESGEDVRPYGNFVIDRDQKRLFAFTMRDGIRSTRYFSFQLPSKDEGETDEEFKVKKVVLTPEDVLDSFDCEYHRFIQGACMEKGLIYSLEGFTKKIENPPALRIVDPRRKKQIEFHLFADFGLEIEPEFIDFYEGVCYYSDCRGNFYTIEY